MSWLVYAMLGVLLMGISPIFAKSGMRKCSSDLAAAVYGTVLFVAVNCMVSVTGTPLDLTQIKLNTFMYLLFSGFAIGVAWLCLFRALKRGPINGVIPIVEASLIIEILASVFIFHEGLSVNRLFVLILLGVGVFCMGMRTDRKKTKSAKKNKGIWIKYAIIAMLFAGLASVLERIGTQDIHENLKKLVCYGIALVVVWILTFAGGNQKGIRFMSFLDGIYISLSGATVGGAWSCFYKARLLSGGFNIEIIALFDLAVAVIFGCIFMRERVPTRATFGMILMLAGFLIWNMKLPIIPFL